MLLATSGARGSGLHWQLAVARTLRLVCLLCTTSWWAMTAAIAQTVEHGLSADERIQLAHQLLDPIAESATDEEDLRQRHPNFLTNYSLLNPGWVAHYILEHPLPEGSPLYHHNATLQILARAQEVDVEAVKQLIATGQFMRSQYALRAIQSMPDMSEQVREELVALGVEVAPNEPTSPLAFPSRLVLAELSQDQAVLQATKESIDQFFTSGQAADLVQSLPQGQGGYIQAICQRYAPDSLREAFHTAEPDGYYLQQAILSNEALSVEQKRAELQAVETLQYGTELHQIAGTASMLGSVALVDVPLALSWAELAPSSTARIWARLTIAPALAKSDQAAASRLVQDCYQELDDWQSDPSDIYALNVPGSLLASHALPLVAATDARLLPECIEVTVRLDRRPGELIGLSQATHFETVTALARYAPHRAAELFERYASDVNTGYAASFFKALLAVAPEQVWQEYTTMPRVNSSGVPLRDSVRSALAPALVEPTSSGFWNKLCQNSWLTIPEGVLANP